MLGTGCDEKKCAFLGARNPFELAEIQKAYQAKFGRDLLNELQKELKGHFKQLVLDSFLNPLDFDVHSLHRAMKGPGSDGDAITEILVTKSNAQKDMIKRRYQELFGENLEHRLRKELSGNFEDFVLTLLVPREENPNVVDNNAREDSIALYHAGEGKVGTDEKKFIHILGRTSFPHIAAINRHYQAVSKKHHTLLQAVDGEFSGHLKYGLLSVINIASFGLVDFFCEVAMKAMKGAGTNDEKLIRVILLNRGPAMGPFKQQFRAKYNKPLKEWVHSETSGAYRDALMLMIGDT